MKIYHYTAPHAARCIADQYTYYGGASFEDGLNAVPATYPWKKSPGYSWDGAENTNALLELEWKGPVVRNPNAGMTPNTLYDLTSHRLFIPAGTTKHLYLTGMLLRPKLKECYWMDADPVLGPRAFQPSSWRFALKFFRQREILRWRERDLELARRTIIDVSVQGRVLKVASETERPRIK